jgi:hypothetical protein
MGLIKDRHGTYYARHKVPERLQAVVARILDNGKARQVWLKKSLGTKVVAQANVRAKPVQMEFDRILAQAESQLKKAHFARASVTSKSNALPIFSMRTSLQATKRCGWTAGAMIRCTPASTSS